MKNLSGVKVSVLLLPVLFLSTGCLYSGAHPLGVEPSAKFMESAEYEVIGDGEGRSSSFTLFSLVRVTSGCDGNEAVDEAVKCRGGDNLIEAVFTRERKIYIIGTVDIIHVKGKVIRYLR
ncbi:MAG TPA: hypothetical protein PK358_06980 [Spirochaetota bacterium]|nr:hypothetical protein [Spirochaetota bacterium]HPJ34562.1 hypothetical protein [Spirochaetota bacterium]